MKKLGLGLVHAVGTALYKIFIATLTVALIGGGIAALANYNATQGSGTAFGSIVVSAVHYAQMLLCDPTTPAQCVAVSAGGAAKVDNSAVTQPIVGSVNVNDGAGNALTSSAAGATRPLDITVRDTSGNAGSLLALGANTAANSAPVTIGPALLGSYCMAASSGTMAAGLSAGSPVFSYRYGGANLAIIRKVELTAGDTSTAFAAGVFTFNMFAARAFTASDTGGTASTLTGNNGKLRTSFATTAISDFRISSTATLTAGTRTLDATQMSSITTSDQATAGNPIFNPGTYLLRQQVGESPMIIATNEGFVIQGSVPATGTWTFSVNVCWDEVAAY